MPKSLLYSILRYKCPRCRQGNMYKQRGIWPLKTMMDMPTNCPICNQKFELETGFYFGTGYVSYALSVAYIVAYFVAYHILIGLDLYNGSIIRCLIYAIISIILLQPVLMRFSRVLFLHLFVKFDKQSKTN
jgi:uncharacterized protein (DUF983 family)